MGDTSADTILVPQLVLLAANDGITSMPVFGGNPAHKVIPNVSATLSNRAKKATVSVPDNIFTLTVLANRNSDNAERSYASTDYEGDVVEYGDAFGMRDTQVESIVAQAKASGTGLTPSQWAGRDVQWAYANSIGVAALGLVLDSATDAAFADMIVTAESVGTPTYEDLEDTRSKFGRERFILGPNGKKIEDVPAIIGPSNMISKIKTLKDGNVLLNKIKTDPNTGRVAYDDTAEVIEADELQDDDFWYVAFSRSGAIWTLTREIKIAIRQAQKKIADYVNVECIRASVVATKTPGGQLPPLAFYRIPKS